MLDVPRLSKMTLRLIRLTGAAVFGLLRGSEKQTNREEHADPGGEAHCERLVQFLAGKEQVSR